MKRASLIETETDGDKESQVTGAANASGYLSRRQGRPVVVNTVAAEGGTGQYAGEGIVCARVESDEGSTAFPSNGVELMSPSGSTFASRYPPQLIQELRARIVSKGADEVVVVEGLREGVLEEARGRGCGEREQETKGLVPTSYGRRPGDLKSLFVRALMKAHNDDAVYVAQTALERPSGGPFQLKHLGVLGDGSFGTVSAVRHPVRQQKYALKTLREVRPTMAFLTILGP